MNDPNGGEEERFVERTSCGLCQALYEVKEGGRNSLSGLTGCQGRKVGNKQQNKHNPKAATESFTPWKVSHLSQ